MIFSSISITSAQMIQSGVYKLERAKTTLTDYGSIRKITEGMTRDFKEMEITYLTLNRQAKYSIHKKPEKMVIVHTGRLWITIDSKEYVLGSGSVMVLPPGSSFTVQNNFVDPASFYLFQYIANDKTKKDDFQPIVKNWDDIEFKPHDKGGIRNFFDVETPECKKFEMHVTNLNAGIKSHEPHTHRAAEFVLMFDGNAEMEIDGEIYESEASDLYFLESEISHAIKNIGSEQCQYFAFQME